MTDNATMQTIITWAPIIISGFALIISWRTSTTSNKLNRLQTIEAEQRMAQQNKADITARFLSKSEHDSNAEVLELKNVGNAKALSVYMKLDINSKDDPFIDREEKLPYNDLSPGNSIRLIASISLSSSDFYDLHITWDNPDGTKGEKIERVSLS